MRKPKKDKTGYILIYKPDHPHSNSDGYFREHRLIMEEKLKRYLTKDEVVHHINHIKDDNRIENLMLLDVHTHGIEERTGYKHTENTKKKMSIARKKQIPPMLGKKHTEKTKKIMSNLRKEYWLNQ